VIALIPQRGFFVPGDTSEEAKENLLRFYLTRQEFESAVRGTLSAEDYRKILVEKGILRGNN